MTKIISVFSKGKRQDIPADEFVKMLEKGGPGSGRKPEGKSVGDEEKSNRGMGFTIDEKSKGNLGLKATGQYWATGNKTDKVTPFGNFSETEVEHESGSKHWVPTGNAQMMGYLKMGKQ